MFLGILSTTFQPLFSHFSAHKMYISADMSTAYLSMVHLTFFYREQRTHSNTWHNRHTQHHTIRNMARTRPPILSIVGVE